MQQEKLSNYTTTKIFIDMNEKIVQNIASVPTEGVQGNNIAISDMQEWRARLEMEAFDYALMLDSTISRRDAEKTFIAGADFARNEMQQEVVRLTKQRDELIEALNNRTATLDIEVNHIQQRMQAEIDELLKVLLHLVMYDADQEEYIQAIANAENILKRYDK